MEKQFTFGDRTITIREMFPESSGELGSVIWDAATVMLSYVEAEREYYKGKRVIELGAGTGIVGIGAAICGADVIVTDLGSLVELMDENIKMNGVEKHCESKELFWGADPAPFKPPFDVILLSDVITQTYMEHFPALAKTLVDLSDENTRISLGFERRLASRDEEFFALLKEHFTWEEVPDVHRFDPFYKDSNRLHIFEIRRKKAN